MKTKKEICQETGISESTFTFWQGKGLIPKPDGIEKRSALWSETIIGRHPLHPDQAGRGHVP